MSLKDAALDDKAEALLKNFQGLAELGELGLLRNFSAMGRSEQILTAAQIQLFTAGVSSPEALQSVAENVGFDEVHIFNTRTVQGVVLVEDGVAFVTFCGTNEWGDVARHSKGVGTQETPMGGMQPGYYQAAIAPDTAQNVSANSAVQDILLDLEAQGKVNELYITGFSDGGNIGTIVATEIQSNHARGEFPLEVSGMFAFDSPPPGDARYAAHVEEVLGDSRYNRIEADVNMVNAIWNIGQKVVTLGEFVQPDVGVVMYADGVHSHNLLEMIALMNERVGANRDVLVQQVRDEVNSALRGRLSDAALAGVDLAACGVQMDTTSYAAGQSLGAGCNVASIQTASEISVSG